MLALNCSITWCQNDSSSFTGVVEQDSVLVSINSIRIANAKMIELKYEKEINTNLRNIVKTDSILISSLSVNLDACELNKKEEINKYRKQRNKAIIFGIESSLILILLLIIKK